MHSCTLFCERLKTISLKDRLLPSHDELKTHLQFSGDNGECHLGTWSDLQLRKHCNFCQLVITAVSSHDDNVISDHQPISVLIFPGEQSFRLSYPSRLGLRLAFVAEDSKYVVGPDTARLVTEENIQISLIEKWLRTCDEKHGVCWPKPAEVDPFYAQILRTNNPKVQTNFRVLDLELGCVTPADLETCKYVTLSYVWGNLPSFRLNAKNFEKLSAVGSLEGIRNHLPKTINDAIDFTKEMGMRYLWVDALCLVQDDVEDVREGVEMMNKVYSGSYFTIVAGSGIDASAGLPGACQVSRGISRINNSKEVAPGIKMTILQSIDHHLSTSTYNTRGWTMQEQLLPRRTLIFIDGQVHFRCQEANWNEESWSDKYAHYLDPDDTNISRIPSSGGRRGDEDGMKGVLQALWAYQKIFEENSRRILRNEGDALRAVTGILGPLGEGMRSNMIEGVPGAYLDHFLLFSSTGGNLRRREGFANFSWAGWEGEIIWPRENFIWPDDDGEEDSSGQLWKTGNIWKYFEHNRLLDFESLDPERGVFRHDNWTFASKPDRIYELMWEYPGVFADTDISLAKNFSYWKWMNPERHDEIPAWNSIYSEFAGYQDEDVLEKIRDGMEGFVIKKEEVEEGREEFKRLKKGIVEAREGRRYSNMLAAREFRAYKRMPDSYSWRFQRDRANSRFRELHSSQLDSENKFDCRLTCAQQWKEAQDPNFEIPVFPRYTILHFSTISLLLTLRIPVPIRQKNQGQKKNFDRLPGLPLFSKTGDLVGSLHPDNVDSLQASTETGRENFVECIVISRSNTPLPESALLTLGNGEDEGSWKLFWVLHIIWKDGIAERRGAGQVLCGALEGGCGEGVEKKLILLG